MKRSLSFHNLSDLHIDKALCVHQDVRKSKSCNFVANGYRPIFEFEALDELLDLCGNTEDETDPLASAMATSSISESQETSPTTPRVNYYSIKQLLNNQLPESSTSKSRIETNM
mmetsp:Transcript_15319/g.23066  ORF Transcript_15319/g.23066 Transcript_15319/m.23066 type:complete len:114 (+) Transcript_15319:128-469(+)